MKPGPRALRRFASFAGIAFLLATAGCTAPKTSLWRGDGRAPTDVGTVRVSCPSQATFGFRAPGSGGDAAANAALVVGSGTVDAGVYGAAAAFEPPEAGFLAGTAILVTAPANMAVAALGEWLASMPEDEARRCVAALDAAGAKVRATEGFVGALLEAGRRESGFPWLREDATGRADDLLVEIQSVSVRLDPRSEGEFTVTPALRCIASVTVVVSRRGSRDILSLGTFESRGRRHGIREWAANDGALVASEVPTVMNALAREVATGLFPR